MKNEASTQPSARRQKRWTLSWFPCRRYSGRGSFIKPKHHPSGNIRIESILTEAVPSFVVAESVDAARHVALVFGFASIPGRLPGSEEEAR